MSSATANIFRIFDSKSISPLHNCKSPKSNMKTFRLVRIVALALLLLTVVGTAGFHYIEHWSWFDSFYMVVITLSTIGYQEVHELSHAGRVFNVALITAGVAIVFLMIGSA